MDEFQDTTELQYAVLKMLYDQGRTTLFVVGDQEQSIFSFAGASLKTYEAAASHLPAHLFCVNYRSTDNIVRFLNIFLRSERKLIAGSAWRNLGIPVYVLVGEVEHRARILAFMELRKQHALTGTAENPPYLILARGAETTRCLATAAGAESVESGDVFRDLEEKHPQLNSILKEFFRARKLLDLREHSRAFRRLDRGLSRLILKANPGFGSPGAVGLTRESWRMMVCTLLRAIGKLNDGDVREWSLSLAGKIRDTILGAGGIKAGKKLVLLNKVGDNLKKKTVYAIEDALRCVDVADEVVTLVRTVHRAKGLQAEAVLVVAATGGQFTEWMNPYGSGKPRTEVARIGYVGFSRAMKLLCIATDSANTDTRRMLAKCEGVEIVEL